MRRAFVLLALLAVMLGLGFLQHDTAQAAPMVLAAIGFVLLSSFTVAEMGSALTLPRVTGYILTGAVLHATGILSSAVVVEMKMFNTLALGLIAVSAGLELSVGQLKKVWRTLSVTVGAKLLITAPLVGGAFYLYESKFGSLGLSNGSEILALSLVLAALSVGTSPSIALALITETKAKGRLTDLVLGAAVLKDLVVVVALAVAVAVARGLSSGAGFELSSLKHVLVEIGFSLLSGGVLGGLLILYIRYVKAEMLLFVAAMILVVAEVSSLLHLELLLVFIMGGFVVRNFSRYEHDLLDPVQLVSLPVFVVFFTIAGASIDVGTTIRILPVALTVCVVRAIGFKVSAAAGNAFGKETDAVRENAWLGYLPQAGVTLGLVGIASTQLPNLMEPIMATGMAVVAINLLAGPVTLRVALKRAGETNADQAKAVALADAGTDEGSESLRSKLPIEVSRPLLRVERQLEEELTGNHLLFQRRFATDLVDRFLVISADFDERDPRWQERWLELRAEFARVDETSELCREAFLSARRLVRTLPEVVEVPLETELRAVKAGDSLGIRFQKRNQAFFRVLTFNHHPVRIVPLRELGRLGFEPRLAEFSARMLSSRMRLGSALLEDLCCRVRDDISAEELRGRIEERVAAWFSTIEGEATRTVERALDAVVVPALTVDSVYLARSQVRASSVDRAVRSALAELESGPLWLAALDAGFERILAASEQQALTSRLIRTLDDEVIRPTTEAAAGVAQVLRGWAEATDELAAEVIAATEDGIEPWISRSDALESEIRSDGATSLEPAMARFRSSLELRGLVHEISSGVEGLREVLVLPVQGTAPSQASAATEIEYRKVELRKIAEKLLEKDAVAVLEVEAQRAEEEPRRISFSVFRQLEDVRLRVRTLAEEPDAAEAKAKMNEALVALAAHIRAESELLSLHQAECTGRMRQALLGSSAELKSRLELDGLSLSEIVRRRRFGDLADALASSFRASRGRARAALTSAEKAIREVLVSDFSQEVRARAQAGELDAAYVRAQLKRQGAHGLPSDYTALFQPAPLRETSGFVARRGKLRALLQAEREWVRGGPASVLLVGDAGSGKTSLLNLMQHGSSSRSVIRVDPLEWKRKVGLLQALAYELGCRARPGAILAMLKSRQTLIVIDDLEHWILPGTAGLGQLEPILDLVAKSREHTFWAISAGSSWVELHSQLSDVGSCFGRVMRLAALSSSEVGEVIEQRHAASGRALHFPKTALSWALGARETRRDRALFFELIRRISGGNLARALQVWLQLAKVLDDGSVAPRIASALSSGMPFLRRLSAEQLALLALLIRTGPLTEHQVADELACTLPQAIRHVSFLRTAGLLVHDAERELILVDTVWAPALLPALREVSAL